MMVVMEIGHEEPRNISRRTVGFEGARDAMRYPTCRAGMADFAVMET
jgi:hypothetical protein